MQGKDVYINKYNERTKAKLKENPDKDYLTGFYYYLEADYSSTTVYNYISYVLNFINFCDKTVEDLNLDDYSRFLSSISTRTSSYKIAVHSALKIFSKYLAVSDRNKLNPMQYKGRPKSIESEETVKKREKNVLTVEEVEQCINQAKKGTGSSRAAARQKEWSERDLLIILLFLNTGMRSAALYKLDVDSIDFMKNTLTVTDKGSKKHEYYLSESVLIVLKSWLDKRNDILNNKKENALFISNQKKRMDQSSISRIVKKYTSGIKNKNITPHKLRATYGTLLYEQTHDIYFVQDCMGHQNPKTTEIYIRGQKNTNKVTAARIMSEITCKN